MSKVLVLFSNSCLASGMFRPLCAWLLLFVVTANAFAAAKPHVVAFGPWTTVRWDTEGNGSKPLTLKVRPLLVDGRLKEYTLGPPHDVTERLFVVRRAFRLNDSLPEESASTPRWQWQRGGWILVDRVSGRVTPVNLPEFDTFSSVAAWYRDYVAYCGVGENGGKLYAIVAQLNRRKPVLKKPLGDATSSGAPDSACPAPTWERQPPRVTFEPPGDARQTFAIHGQVADAVTDDDEDSGTSQ